MRKEKDYYTFKDGAFLAAHSIPENIQEVAAFEVGVLDGSRYLFHHNTETGEYKLGSVFVRDYSSKQTPPYSMLVTGKFYKDQDKIYYVGGFSIV